MQRAFDTRTVVGIEVADAFYDIVDVFPNDLLVAQGQLFVYIAGCRHSPDIQDDLEQIVGPIDLI